MVSASPTVVETVRGPVAAADLGPTLTHEHVVFSSLELAHDYPELAWPQGRDAAIKKAVRGLEDISDRGIRTIVDCTAIMHSRDMEFLREVNDAVDINIVVSTGIYSTDYVPYFAKYRTPTPEGGDVLTRMFLRDLTQGIGDSGVRAQNIKIATDVEGVTPNNERILRAAARAAVESGAPITAHTHAAGRVGLDQLRIFAAEGVDLSTVIVGHSGDTTDLDYLHAVLATGATIASDRFGQNTPGRATEQERLNIIARLCTEGYAGQIVISHDCVLVTDWMDDFESRFPPTWVPTRVSDVIIPALRDQGVSPTDLDQMMVHNAVRLFAR